jgi:GH18 family chitinase/sugar lactone lactonase YvrE
MPASQVDYTKLTHVIYWPVIPNAGAAASATAPGTLYSLPFGLSQAAFDTNANALIAGAHAAGAKALLGVGGDAYSAATPDNTSATQGFQVSTGPTYQATFISNIVAMVTKYGFDGVDINWEQIRTSDNAHFTSFIANLRAALTAASPGLLLTMPPETSQNGGRPDLIAQVYQELDQINIQTYQMSGPYCAWETWYNSPLNNGGATFILVSSEQLPSITGAIAVYTGAPYNIPAGKLGMGIQLDSEIWMGGTGTSTGGVTEPKQTWTGDNNDAFCSTTNPDAPTTSTLPYRQTVPLETTAGYTMTFDSVADQSWLSFDPSGGGTVNENKDRFISFDSPTSIAKKGVDLSAGAGLGGSLGGVFLFELSGDYAAAAAAGQQHPLLYAANSMQNLLPGAVTGLTITPATASATLKWNSAPFATGYKVYYSTNSGSAGTLASTAVVDQATISALAAGQKYYFQVQPVNSFGVATGGIATGSATIPGLIVPTITWVPNPASIPYGTPVTAAQLNATASVAGTFSYSAKPGEILAVGADSLTVTFTPSAAGYATATKTATITVTAATLNTSASFGTVTLGSWSDAHSIELTYKSSNTTAVTTAALTMGAAGLDFIKNSGACSYNATTTIHTCFITLTFSPQGAGTRKGAAVMQQGGATVATAYISGIGSGPQAAFDPGTATAIPFLGTTSPNGTAVDGGGYTYLADSLNNKIWKIGPKGVTSTYVSGLSGAPYAPALDGAGNLYVAVGNTVLKITQSGVQSTLGSGWSAVPKGIAVDSAGNVFVSNTLANTVVKITPGGAQSTVLSGSVLGAALNLPAGVAIDGDENLYVADSGNNRVLKVTSSGVASLVLDAGVTGPYGVAVSDSGSLYLADPGNNRILKFNAAGTQSTVLSGTVVGFALSAGTVAVDGAENLFLSDGPHQRLLKIMRATPPSLGFVTTSVGSTSSDSPKTITVESIGNAALVFPAPRSGTNASLSPDFVLGTSTTCPDIRPGSSAVSIAAGSSCKYAVRFKPTVTGSITGTLVLGDNSLNVLNGEQTAGLKGTGKAATPIPATVTLAGLSATYTGSPIPVTATTNPLGLAVSITYNGSASAPTAAGSYAIAATVTTAGYIGSASGTEVISKATPVITWAAPAAVTAPFTLGAAQLNAKASNGALAVAGSFVYTPASGTALAAGTYTLKAQFTPTDTADFNTPAVAQQTLVVNPQAGPQRVVWVPDYYGGLLQVRVGSGATPTAITIVLPTCNPNAVAVNSNHAYVVCNSDEGNPDKILVYNAATIRAAAAGTLAISPTQTITSAQFSSLIGITLDASNDLWVASYGNNQVDEITAAALATATPAVTASLVNSPGSPVALAFDKDGSLWVTGQFGGGILLNFPTSQLQQGANANPDYCLATTNVGGGCQFISDVFLSPEGLALFDGDVWVGNNSTGAGGNVPGRELVDLKYAAGAGGGLGTLTVNATFGSSTVAADSPFVCPGGLYGGSVHLWVNDESYGEANPQCGAAGDVASKTGGIFDFTAAQLTAKTTTVSQVLAYSNITGRPGFGGIFVENDQ